MNAIRQPAFTVNVKGVAVSVKVRYADMSSKDYTEEQLQQMYPAISIYDYAPELANAWNNGAYERYVQDLREPDEDGKPTRGTIFYEPLLLTFRFDVQAAAKSYHEMMAIENALFLKLMYEPFWLRHEVIAGEDIGESVNLNVTPTRTNRIDGVHEVIFECDFDTFVAIKEPTDVDLVTTLILNVNPVGLDPNNL